MRNDWHRNRGDIEIKSNSKTADIKHNLETQLCLSYNLVTTVDLHITFSKNEILVMKPDVHARSNPHKPIGVRRVLSYLLWQTRHLSYTKKSGYFAFVSTSSASNAHKKYTQYENHLEYSN